MGGSLAACSNVHRCRFDPRCPKGPKQLPHEVSTRVGPHAVGAAVAYIGLVAIACHLDAPTLSWSCLDHAVRLRTGLAVEAFPITQQKRMQLLCFQAAYMGVGIMPSSTAGVHTVGPLEVSPNKEAFSQAVEPKGGFRIVAGAFGPFSTSLFIFDLVRQYRIQRSPSKAWAKIVSNFRAVNLPPPPPFFCPPPAVFHPITEQAVMKLVSEGAVEKVKHSYRLSPKCIADEKASAKEESRRKGGSTPAVQTPQVMARKKGVWGGDLPSRSLVP